MRILTIPARALAFGVPLLASTVATAVDIDVIAPLHSPATGGGEFALDPVDLTLALAIAEDGAASSGEGNEGLAKQLQNPVAALISVPFQFNYDQGFGAKDAGRVLLNVQPVIPIGISEDWNLIIRTIVPVVYQGSTADGVSSEFGPGDTTQSFFFSPKEPVGGWILGFGPACLWPTATDRDLGTGKWGVGPTVLGLRQEGPWTFGMLANHIWSYAGPESRRDVNSTFLQPFITYTFPTATTIALNTESTYDWDASEWSVPLNLMVSQVLRLGPRPISFQLGGRYWAETPEGGPEWGLRFSVTLLFPK